MRRDVRTITVPIADLHVGRIPSARMRGPNGDAVGEGETDGVLRRCEEAQRGPRAAGAARRGKSAVGGFSITGAGVFWIVYLALIVAIAWWIWT